MSTSAKTERRKACIVCGVPFRFRRSDAKTCGRDACRKTLSRRNGKPPRLPGDDAAPLWRPPSLHLAQLFLQKGGLPHHLLLSRSEHDALVASVPRFPVEQRLEAAKRLLRACTPWAIGRAASIRAVDDGLLPEQPERNLPEFLVLVALEHAQAETNVFGNWRLDASGKVTKAGRPVRVAPYVPAREPWGNLLHNFLPRELERLFKSFAADHQSGKGRAASLSFQGPAGTGDDGRPRTLDDAVGATDPALTGKDAELFRAKPRGSGFARYPQALSRPSDPYLASGEPADANAQERAEWLRRWEKANPALGPWELDELRRELGGGQCSLRYAFREYEERKAEAAWDADPELPVFVPYLADDDEPGNWSDEAVQRDTYDDTWEATNV